MDCAYFLMGYYKIYPKQNKYIIDKIDEYSSKTEKTLLDNLEFMIYIAGAYDKYKERQISVNTINNLMNIEDDELRAVYYENIMKHKYLKDIYHYIYTNREEILKLSEQTKTFLNLVYISGARFFNCFNELNDFIRTYKEKDYTEYINSYMDGLIECYAEGFCKLRPF